MFWTKSSEYCFNKTNFSLKNITEALIRSTILGRNRITARALSDVINCTVSRDKELNVRTGAYLLLALQSWVRLSSLIGVRTWSISCGHSGPVNNHRTYTPVSSTPTTNTQTVTQSCNTSITTQHLKNKFKLFLFVFRKKAHIWW